MRKGKKTSSKLINHPNMAASAQFGAVMQNSNYGSPTNGMSPTAGRGMPGPQHGYMDEFNL